MALLRLPASAKTPASAIVLSDGSFVNEDCSDSYLYPTCGGTPDDARPRPKPSPFAFSPTGVSTGLSPDDL